MSTPEYTNPRLEEYFLSSTLSGRLPNRIIATTFKWKPNEVFQSGDYLQGLFRLLPLEIIHDCFQQLDIATLVSLACTSKGMNRVVGSLPKLRALLDCAPDAMRAVAASRTRGIVICADMYQKLISPVCDDCENAGPFLYLLSCTRLCGRCLSSNERYRALRPMQAVEQYALSISDIRNLPTLIVPKYCQKGRHYRCRSYRQQINTTGWRMVDELEVQRLSIGVHGSIEQAKRAGAERLTRLLRQNNSHESNATWQTSQMLKRRVREMRHLRRRYNVAPEPGPTGRLRFHLLPDAESACSASTNFPWLDLAAQNFGYPVFCEACYAAGTPRRECYYSAPGTNQHMSRAQSTAYLVRLGLALSKVCINHADLETARITLQKVTEYLPSSVGSTATADSDGRVSSHVDYASYYILRIALSWKDDRIDLAEHMYSKLTQYTSHMENDTRTTLIRLLIHIGQDLVAKSEFVAAVRWYRRAAAESSAPPHSGRNTATDETQLKIDERTRLLALRGLAQCLTSPGPGESLDEATSIVRIAQAEFGERRVEVLEMLVMVQAAKGDASDALTDLLEVLLP
ncbi:hypothetical protein V2A60_008590 [Cordyceps javanica]